MFCEQNQHRGREEELGKVCTELPGDVGTACSALKEVPRIPVFPPWWLSAESCLQLGFPRAEVSMCLYSLGFPIGGGPNDSWSHCFPLQTFSDLVPEAPSGCQAAPDGTKSQVQGKK